MNAHSEHGSHGAHGTAHAGSLKDYLIGFVLAVILTAIPFWLVIGKRVDSSSIAAALILGFAGIQTVVHMVYFLHMNTKSEGGWTLLALLFTTMLLVITLSGSIWVMYHMNHNMMPASMHGMHGMHDMRNMP